MTVTVKQLLDSKPSEIFTVHPGDTVFEAIKVMDEKRVSALLVTENKQLRGIISERDYSRKVILKNRMSKTTRVDEIMSQNLITVGTHNSIEDCLRLMSNHHIRHLPVIDKNCICGILSIMDVIKSILSEKEFIIKQLESYIGSGVA